MPIENRNLEPGTVLVARYKKQDRTCEVVKTDAATPGYAQSGLRYRLDDGTEHNSPSSAGKAAMGGVACNGWRFWSIAGTEAPKKAKKEPVAKKSAAKKSAKGKGAKKGKGKAATSGDSYGCGACGESFPTQKKAVAHALTHSR